jgi:proteasome activator subunit 3 (PA28 gamma)
MAGKLKTAKLHPEIERYVNDVKEKSETLVKTDFPNKIIELNRLLESSDFNIKESSKYHTYTNDLANAGNVSNHNNHEDGPAQQGKKRKYEKVEEVPTNTKAPAALCNKSLTRLIDIVKPHIRDLVEDANLLKMWVTFLIPKIEDGNNFGVSIQEDTLGEIRTVEAEAATFYEQISRYYLTRGKIISKVGKYPQVEDYKRLVGELDEKEFLSLRIVLSEIRNHYASMYDLIIKNMEKIILPRTSNAENLY